jgi:4-carboxymuconolactone decarboxylase
VAEAPADRAARHADTGRLPALRPEDLDAAGRAVYDEIVDGPRAAGPGHFVLRRDDGSLAGPFNLMLHAPRVGGPLAALGAALRFESSLDARQREIAILAVAAVRRSDYEWYAHEQVGRAVGLDDAVVATLRAAAEAPGAGADPDGGYGRLPDPDDDLVRRVALAIVRDRTLGADLHAEAERRLGTAALVELVILAGYYDLVAAALAAFAVTAPEGDPPFVPAMPAAPDHHDKEPTTR